MVLLRIHLAVALAALLLSGCKFDPAVYGLGYQKCDTTAKCAGGGLVCLKGLCVPDCQGAYTVAWLEPGSVDDTGDGFEAICSGGECGISVFEEEGLKMPFLDVTLPFGAFLDLGSEKEDVDECSRVVFRFSVLAPAEGENQGLELSVVIRGNEATGLVPDVLQLRRYVPENDIYKQFLEQTYFYVVDTSIFAWPVRLRLVPIASNSIVYFGIRDFEMSCCN
jgi:hypothetical protein